MELYKQILAEYIAQNVHFEELENIEAIIHDRCYQTLSRIKQILEDDSLEDSECFYRIEEIVRAFEELGSDAGARHDFG